MMFSIVIPVAPNRGAEVLESIKNLNYLKKNFEIIVEKGKNPSNNRNNGVAKSKGKYVIFLDDDALIKQNYLNKIEEFIQKHPGIDIVGGPQLTPIKQKEFGILSGYALESKFGGWNLSNRYKKGKINLNADETYLTSANLVVKKEVFKKIKFNPLLFPGEDPDFIDRAKRYGFKIAYSPEIVVFHKRRESPKELAQQIFNYGKTRPKKEKISKTMRKPFFIIPSLFFLYYLFLTLFLVLESFFILLGLKFFDTFITLIIFSPFTLYIVLSLITSLIISIKKTSLKSLFTLPFIFLIIHFSYGLGLINGLIKKQGQMR